MAEYLHGDVPFYGYPFVQLRGVPAMRYQDERVLNLEVEGRWQFWKRWSLVGFVGKGFADGDVSVQDGAAQLAAPWLLNGAPARVLDACAAPGGTQWIFRGRRGREGGRPSPPPRRPR